MLYSTLFFDLDDTLYPHTAGLWEAIRLRMDRYMVERLGLAEEAVAPLRTYYLETYGTTLRGLQNHFHVNTQEFLAFVHDLPLDYLQPNPALNQV
jgi:putative hydrolase of the HAD superfamily